MSEMTPTDINRKIAEWLGWKLLSKTGKEMDGYYIKNGKFCGYSTPNFYNTNAAFDLLDVLKEKDYSVSLHTAGDNWKCQIAAIYSSEHYHSVNKSKSAAICETMIALIEKGGGE